MMANYGEMSVVESKLVLDLKDTERVTFAADATYGDNLVVGAIVAKNALGGATKDETGDAHSAVLTLATYPVAANASSGEYVLTCVQEHAAAVENVSAEVPEKWSVTAPDGDTVLGYIELVDSNKSAGVDWDNQVRFNLKNPSLDSSATAGSVDVFGVTVAAGSGKLEVWNPVRNTPWGLLLEAADATSADVKLSVLTAGLVDKSKIVSVLGNAAPVEQALDALRMNNIIAKEVI